MIKLYIVEKKILLFCLQAFSTKEKLKFCIKGFFKINGKQIIIMPKKGEYVKFKKVNMSNSKIMEKNKVTLFDKCRF